MRKRRRRNRRNSFFTNNASFKVQSELLSKTVFLKMMVKIERTLVGDLKMTAVSRTTLKRSSRMPTDLVTN